MINNNRAIRQYQAAATNNIAQFDAMKTISPFWNKIEDSDKNKILAFMGEFKQARSGICCSASETAQNEILTALQDYLQTKQLLQVGLSMDKLVSSLYSLMKNANSFMKVKVPDGLNSLLFCPQQLVADNPIPGGKQFLISHSQNDSDFAKKLLTNLNQSNPKPILIFTLASKLSNFPINTTAAQSLIAFAILNDKFGTDSLLLKPLAEGLARFTYLVAQRLIADAVKQNKFGKDPLVLVELAKSIASFTCPMAQQRIATAIWDDKFGQTPLVCGELAKSVASFTCQIAQQSLSSAIVAEKFGKDPLVLVQLAKSIPRFRDPEAQRTIVKAIWFEKFGHTYLVLVELAKSVASFTCPRAQKNIATAIWNGKFGQDPLVLVELAKSIASFTFPMAQQNIATAIWNNQFGNAPLVLLELAKSIAGYTCPRAQQGLASTIGDGKFGKNPLVLVELAKSITRFSDPKAQQNIAAAIKYGKFGQDPLVMVELAKSITSFSVPIAQFMVAKSIRAGKLGRLTQGQLKSIISRWVMSTRLYQEISTIVDPTKSFLYNKNLQFGQFRKYSYADDAYEDIAGINLDICFGCASDINGDPSLALSGYGTHGIIYNNAGEAEFLLTYREDVTVQNPEHAIEERFEGFFSPDNSHFVLYQNNFPHLQIYDINPGKDGYPVLLDKIVSSDKFNSFPHWLQQAIHGQEFNPQQYQSPHILGFVLAFIDSLPFAQADIGKKTREIIITIIKGQGNPFSLSADPKFDAKIKNEINEAFMAEDNAVLYGAKLDTFWQTLTTTDDKLKLIFLLGQIAKKGALGYHFGVGDGNNTANRAFYKLTEHGVANLIQETVANLPAYLKTMANHLSLGVCIESETNNLMLAHPQISTVWQKKI